MSSPPVTPPEIMALAAPFARRGRHVDLAASDRMARRLAFRETALADDPALNERLWLEDAPGGRHRLVRAITLPSGAIAELQATGGDPAVLLERIEAIPASAQWRRSEGHELAISLRLEAIDGNTSPEAELLRLEYRQLLDQAESNPDGLMSSELPAASRMAWMLDRH